MRVLGGSQWGYQPGAVGGVPVCDLALEDGVIVVTHLQRTAPFALLLRGGDEDLQVGVLEDHGADISPDHHDAVPAVVPLLLDELLPDPGNLADAPQGGGDPRPTDGAG